MAHASVDTDAFRFTTTQDWFSHNISIWSKFLPYIVTSAPRVLEIGSWEGRSGVWLLRNLCSQSGSLVCIDHFDLMVTEAGRQRYSDLVHNLTLAGPGQFRIMKSFSFPALMQLLQENIGASDPGFDWIYVDGSHEADDTHAELAWRLAKKGALFIFDDYHWDAEPLDSIHHPKRGIDAFLDLHAGQYERLTDLSEYQVILQKTSNMRIGFLVEQETPPSLEGAAGYGLNIALAFDSNYAPAAAVTILSAVEHTSGRITFYILERELQYDERDKIEASVPQNRQGDVTIVFISVPENRWLPSSDMSWAKLQMLEILPVERVLYLDVDILVLADLRELWRLDLGDKVIGAAVDVGHPRGHRDLAGHVYFNAGVLLLDLTSIRGSLAELQKLVQDMSSSHFKDQDVLNVHFREGWMELDLRWNAQGLGTYANHSTPERDALDLKHMRNHPYVVHFTGPLHPTLASVINPWVQPYTAKPWGYAGAPGHPFASQWKDTLERTQWKGWLNTSKHAEECVRQTKLHEAQALKAFREAIEVQTFDLA